MLHSILDFEKCALLHKCRDRRDRNRRRWGREKNCIPFHSIFGRETLHATNSRKNPKQDFLNFDFAENKIFRSSVQRTSLPNLYISPSFSFLLFLGVGTQIPPNQVISVRSEPTTPHTHCHQLGRGGGGIKILTLYSGDGETC